MISLVFLIILILTILIAFAVRLSSKSASRRFSLIVCVTLPVLVVAFFVALLFEASFRRAAELHEMDSMLEALKFNMQGNRLYNSEEEKLTYLDSLRIYQSRINAIAKNDSIISLFLGENQEMKERISQTLSTLSNQEKRYTRLNPIDTTEYKLSSSEECATGIRLIEPDNVSLPILNIAYIQADLTSSTRASVLMLVKDENILFCRFFVPRQGVNAFMFPNLFKEGAELRVGYLTSEAGNNIFHYVNYTPYVQ